MPDHPGPSDRPDRPGQPDRPDRPGQPDRPDRSGQPERPDRTRQSGRPDLAAVRRIIDIATGTWQAQALYAAVEFGLADHLAAGRTGTAALAAATGADPDGLARLLRLLTAMGVLERTPDGHRLAPAGESLRADADPPMADLVRVYGDEFHRAWGAVVPALRDTGTTGFHHAHGTTLHDHLRDPEQSVRFQRAMSAGNVFFQDVPDAFDFTDRHTVVDVAGGSGALLGTVLAAHPHLRGILVERPHVVPLAAAHLDAVLGPGRHEVRAADVFEEVPGDGDVHLLSRVLQDWDDERCAVLLARIRAALPPDGRLLIVERVVPDHGERMLPLLYDLHLLMAAGGRERDLDGYRTLLAKAGLRLEAVRELALETSLLIAAPE
ncbi:methyltransferase [Streptomyces sp. LP05-1]|uniref:Methyltransferase n=1 Tax=Streptomyces pyxinae TaxID=2970734 RepID=A0ABT2CK77_9ACTN|nr:methyltransferase [Streptomyces sp. LP05-1]MCS0637823.1 methyltransferase [Streptomyces sp. LP05-1]